MNDMFEAIKAHTERPGHAAGARLSESDVTIASIEAIRRGRRRRSTVQASVASVAMLAVGTGAWLSLPMLDDASDPASSTQVHFERVGDLELLGGTKPPTPDWVQCGQPLPELPSVGLSTEHKGLEDSTVVYELLVLNDNGVWQGHPIGGELPALRADGDVRVNTFVSTQGLNVPEEHVAVETLGVLTDSDGNVVATTRPEAFEEEWPGTSLAIPADYAGGNAMDYAACRSIEHAAEGGEPTDDFAQMPQLEGDYALTFITQVVDRDLRTKWMTFVNYGVGATTVTFDRVPATPIQFPTDEDLAVVQEEWESSSVPLGDAGLISGLQPVGKICDRIETATQGLDALRVTGPEQPIIEAELVEEPPFEGGPMGRDQMGIPAGLAYMTSDDADAWWSGHEIMAFFYSDQGELVNVARSQGNPFGYGGLDDRDEEMSDQIDWFSAFDGNLGCEMDPSIPSDPGTYTVVLMIAGAEDIPEGYDLDQELWETWYLWGEYTVN
jgi:hypothetical protein